MISKFTFLTYFYTFSVSIVVSQLWIRFNEQYLMYHVGGEEEQRKENLERDFNIAQRWSRDLGWFLQGLSMWWTVTAIIITICKSCYGGPIFQNLIWIRLGPARIGLVLWYSPVMLSLDLFMTEYLLKCFHNQSKNIRVQLCLIFYYILQKLKIQSSMTKAWWGCWTSLQNYFLFGEGCLWQ